MLKAQQKHGRRVEVLENVPSVQASLVGFWRGFWELHSCRQYALSANPIGMLDIVAWLEINGIYSHRYDYFSYIKYLDGLYLDWCKEQHAEHTGSSNKGRAG